MINVPKLRWRVYVSLIILKFCASCSALVIFSGAMMSVLMYRKTELLFQRPCNMICLVSTCWKDNIDAKDVRIEWVPTSWRVNPRRFIPILSTHAFIFKPIIEAVISRSFPSTHTTLTKVSGPVSSYDRILVTMSAQILTGLNCEFLRPCLEGRLSALSVGDQGHHG